MSLNKRRPTFDFHKLAKSAVEFIPPVSDDRIRQPKFNYHKLVESDVQPRRLTSIPLSFEADGTQEKIFACSYCGKEFKKSYNRKIHERIHTNESKGFQP